LKVQTADVPEPEADNEWNEIVNPAQEQNDDQNSKKIWPDVREEDKGTTASFG
jgi:hypothetical protein